MSLQRGLTSLWAQMRRARRTFWNPFSLLRWQEPPTRRDAELINSLSDKAYAGIELVSAAGKHSIELKLFSGAPKQVFIDGQRIRRMGELMGVLNAVMFSPEDLSLVKDSPETRRRFMDMELCQLRPAYFYRLQQYNAALKQAHRAFENKFSVRTEH